MDAFKGINVRRVRPDAWEYVIEIADDRGGKMNLSAGIEDLDMIAAAMEEKLQEMIDASEQDTRKSQPGPPPEEPANTAQGDDDGPIAIPTPLEPGDQNSQPT